MNGLFGARHFILLRVANTVIAFSSLFFLGAGFFIDAFATGKAVGTYSLWTRGPVKSLALSGATVASTDNSAAVLENPAGIGFQTGIFRWAFDYGSPRDDSLAQKGADQYRDRYVILGASLLLWKVIGLGVGAEGQTYQTSGAPAPNTIFSYNASQVDGHISAVVKLGKMLSLSGTYVRNLVRRASSTQTPDIAETSNEMLVGSQLRYGLLWRLSQQLSVGATHTRPAVLLPKVNSGESLFDFTYKPEQNRLGISWAGKAGQEKTEGVFPENIKFFAQVDLLRFPKIPKGVPLSFAPSVTYLHGEQYELEKRPRWIPRVAAETTVFRYQPVALRLWGGSYLEPAYLKGNHPRTHFTGGAHFKASIFVLQAAMDFARDFRNRNIGASVEFGF